MYLAKLDEVLSFKNKTKQINNLDKFLQQTQKHTQKVEKQELGTYSDIQQKNLFTEPITKRFVNFTESS